MKNIFFKETNSNRLCYWFILTCFLCCRLSAFSQITTIPVSDAQQLAGAMVGKGNTISNPKIVCPAGASGSFNNISSNINLGKGIVLTTGSITQIGNPSSEFLNTEHLSPGDSILSYIIQDTTNDACALEFDVIPSCDELRFNYVFASEEYPDFVNQINDAFGFFVSGPGITGIVNIAMLPNTNTPVTISNVNDSNNNQYYVPNYQGTTVAYNGFTTPLTASIKVIPCNSYHLKIVIADAGDSQYDSGVFIEGNSLDCPPPEITSALCANQTSIQVCGPAGYTYQWPVGQPGAVPPYDQQCMTVNNPKAGDVYTVNLTSLNGGCNLTGKVTLTVPVINITAATVCEGEKAVVSVSGGKKYLWSTGDTTSSITVAPKVTTTYTVNVVYDNCPSQPFTTVVTVTPKPNAMISGDTSICIGSSSTLTATGGTDYLWNTGEKQPSIQIKPITNTTYSVIVSNGSCKDTTTTAITVNQLPTATASILSHSKTGTALHATGGGTYVWIPAEGLNNTTIADPIATPHLTTDYCVEVTDANECLDTACVRVVFECDDLFIPTAFSPNSDGANEMECVMGNCFQTFQFTIYDRWGEKVFESNNPQLCWDGTYKGKLMNTAVFVYFLKATLVGGEEISRTGNVSLIR